MIDYICKTFDFQNLDTSNLGNLKNHLGLFFQTTNSDDMTIKIEKKIKQK